MKRIIVILSALFIFSPAFTQNYLPVVINGEVFFKTELETSEGIVPAEVTIANFEKINGQLYNRVFFKRNLEADMFIGYLREDPGAGEIYFRTTTNPQEFLVYDISLEVGESIILNARWCDGVAGDVATVVSVTETVGLREVVFDRQIGNDLICETLTFIEGVGPSASLIFPIFRNAIAENGVAQSLCHASHEAVIYYPAGTDTDLCGAGITSTDIPAQAEAIKVFPNPVSTQLQVNGLPAGSTIVVYNGYGQVIPSVFTGQHLDSSKWSAGLYVLEIELPSGERVVRKVVKR
ncbi:T9SS type A sorting domain-containing protein [Lewinella sp. LCG006]|uniref:T9SS type A sorting domain-containing protein n=1 Tax=Lewinella sp. LCG006 TaxID=3231911 RepID=UPI003460167E